MEPVDFYASERAYAEHLLPIWWALKPDERGTFWTNGLAERLVRPEVGSHWHRGYPRPKGPLTVVASYQDLRAADHRSLVLVNHGAGQSYDSDPKVAGHPAYSGGARRDNVQLFIEPGRIAADKTRAANPNAEVVEVGCPKLDWLHKTRPEPSKTIAVSFHWPNTQCPESGWAWPEYSDAVIELTKHFDVIGHAHPRAYRRLERWYREHDIEPIENFADVAYRAQVYVCDNSSTIFEFASLNKPVVLMNSSAYRKHVEHGLRFWSHAGVGIQVSEPANLIAAVKVARALRSDKADRRLELIRDVYSYCDGKAALRAAEAIRNLSPERSGMGTPTNPYAPNKTRPQITPEPSDEPQFPLERLRRIGAPTAMIQEARKSWDSIDDPVEREAMAEEFAATPDADLMEVAKSYHVDGQDPMGAPFVPDVEDMTIPEVLKWVNSSKDRAKLALEAEKKGKNRKTLKGKLKDIIEWR